MSQLSVSDNDSSFERIDSSGASSRLNSPMELLDSEDDLKIQKEMLKQGSSADPTSPLSSSIEVSGSGDDSNKSEVDVKPVNKDKPPRKVSKIFSRPEFNDWTYVMKKNNWKVDDGKEAILEEENLKLKATNEKLETELVSKNQEIQKVQEDLKTQEETTDSERHELHQTKLEMGQWQMKWHELADKVVELEEIIETMELELRDKDQKNKKDVQSPEDQKTLLKDEIEKLKETIEKLEVELKDSKDQTKPLKDENSKLKEDIKEMQETLNVKIEDNQKIWDLVKRLKNENQMLSKELDSTDQKAQKKREEDLKDQMKALETENLNLKRDLDSKDQKDQRMQLELENLKLKLELKDSKKDQDQTAKKVKESAPVSSEAVAVGATEEETAALHFLENLSGVWNQVSGMGAGYFTKFKFESDYITEKNYDHNGKFIAENIHKLSPKDEALQSSKYFVHYIDKNQWVTLLNGQTYVVVEFPYNGKLKKSYFHEGAITQVKHYKQLENDLLVLDDQKDQTKHLKDENSKLNEVIEKMQLKISAKVQDHQKENEQLKETIEKLEIELKNCKDQEVPEQLPILQEINGIWKVVSEKVPENYGSKIGEVVKIEADSERAVLESFKSNGDSNSVTKVQFHTTTVPSVTLRRFDYVENNQWKTIYNKPEPWNVVRSIRDGKLVYEYVEEKGTRYERVYERIEKVPNSDQVELERLKDQVKQLEKELGSKDQKDQKTQEQEPLPILQELNGTWKLTSVEKAGESFIEEFMKIETGSENITVERFRQSGIPYREANYPLYSKVPSKISQRLDYVENNQWKTVDNHHGALNSVKSIKDGKLYFEFIDEQGKSYTDVYTRVEVVADCNAQKELEELKDQVKELEEKNLKLEQDKNQRNQLPIIDNITGSWKLVSLTGENICGREVGDMIIIKANYNSIVIDKFKKTGIKILSRTAQICPIPSSFEDGTLKDYIENNEWVSFRKNDANFKRVRSIEDGRLIIKYTANNWNFTEVYERTYHNFDNSNRNYQLFVCFIFGVFIAALFVLLIPKF